MNARFIFLPILVSVAVPATAQRVTEAQTGSNIAVPRSARIPDDTNEEDAARVVMAEFARCTLDRLPGPTEAALRLPFGQPYDKAMAKLAVSECLFGGELRFKVVLLRGSLFTEFWRRRVIAESKGRPWGPVFAPVDFSVFAAADGMTRQHIALLAFADCVVKRDRADASDIIILPTASKAQRAAYTRLQPNLSPCLDQGASVTFSKQILEGAIAEQLYRTPSPTPAAASGNR